MDLDILARQLATGLARVAVAVHAAGDGHEPAAPRTLVQQQILLLLARRRPEYPLPSLAAELGMSVPTAVAELAALVREGLVSMAPAPSYSPREVQIALTEHGAAQAPRVRHWAADLLAAIDELRPPEQARLLGVVTRHIQVMQRRNQIPVTKMCVTCRFFDAYAHPGSTTPHHCRLIDAPFGHRELRLRCPDQVGAAEPEAAA
jgi:DNA-binding MarR family transcriptional regulator